MLSPCVTMSKSNNRALPTYRFLCLLIQTSDYKQDHSCGFAFRTFAQPLRAAVLEISNLMQHATQRISSSNTLCQRRQTILSLRHCTIQQPQQTCLTSGPPPRLYPPPQTQSKQAKLQECMSLVIQSCSFAASSRKSVHSPKHICHMTVWVQP